jgi:hypothetical protein
VFLLLLSGETWWTFDLGRFGGSEAMSPSDARCSATSRPPLEEAQAGDGRGLEKSGHLDERLDQSADQTSEALAELLHQGVPSHAAWEAVREEWALLPAAPDEAEDEEEEDTSEMDAHDEAEHGTMPLRNDGMDFERIARIVMSVYLGGVALAPGHVPGMPKRFDLISPDGAIVGDAKDYGEAKEGKLATITEYVWLLEKTGARHPSLILSESAVADAWLRRYGALSSPVAFYAIDLLGQETPATDARVVGSWPWPSPHEGDQRLARPWVVGAWPWTQGVSAST